MGYSAQKATALRIISAKGFKVTVIRTKLVSYDPLNPTASAPALDVQTSAYAVILPATTSTVAQFDTSFVKDQVITSFRYILLAAQGMAFEMQLNDIIRINSGDLQVKGLRKLDPDDSGAIIWMVLATTNTNLN